MSNETMVTLQGWMGNEPNYRQVGGAAVTSFRVATTPRRYHQKREEWVDGETQWYTVNAWRGLAEHCERSLRKGDPVLVHGRLTHRTYVNKSEVEVISLEIDAICVGHDLTRGCSQFLKAPPRETVPRPTAEARSAEAAFGSAAPSGEQNAAGDDHAGAPEGPPSAGEREHAA